MKAILLLFISCFFLLPALPAQDSLTVKIHFLYGSFTPPGKGTGEYKKSLGIHAGHVSIEAGEEVVGFEPQGRFHWIARKKNKHSFFRIEKLEDWKKDSVGRKYVSVELSVTPEQYASILNTHSDYTCQTPYDYAFIGMRCTAAAYDLLSLCGIFERKTRAGMILRCFYTKPLRKRMLRYAQEKNYKIVSHPGGQHRIWTTLF